MQLLRNLLLLLVRQKTTVHLPLIQGQTEMVDLDLEPTLVKDQTEMGLAGHQMATLSLHLTAMGETV